MEKTVQENPKVLIVDDDKMIIKLLLTYLPEYGFDVTGFTDSGKALEAIQENQYDVVLTDLVMPIVSGMDIVKAVVETGHDTQIVIATGFATTESAINAVRYGVYDYIRKPFTPMEIRIVLSRAVEKLRMMRDNIKLQTRVENMLSNITMLYNISTILYQVTDFELIVDMVLDTIDEGLSIDRVGLFLFDTKSAKYQIYRSKGIEKELIKTLTFDSGDLLLGKRVSGQEPTIIHSTDTEKNSLLKEADQPRTLGLYPILYQEKLFGFIGIIQDDLDHVSGEKEQLLKILTTQIAPVFGLNKQNRIIMSDEHFFDLPYLEIVNSNLTDAANNHRSENLALIKLTPVISDETPPDFTDVCRKLRHFSKQEFVQENGIYWLEPASFMVSSPSSRLVSLELACVNLRRRLEEYSISKNGKPTITVNYNIASYPDDAQTAEDLILKLNETIFYQSNRQNKQESGERIY